MNSKAAFCMGCQKQVPEEKMTKYFTGKVWRRMCEDCKSRAIDRKMANQ